MINVSTRYSVSKVAADVMVQEYGRYFGMATCCLRGGCLTGPSHSGVELHGFLSYLVKCNIEKRAYKIFGYKGKQVRDNIHSEDVARFCRNVFCRLRDRERFIIWEVEKQIAARSWKLFEICEGFSGKKQKYEYLDENRIGDHICYYSDLTKIKNHYPKFEIKHSLDDTIQRLWRLRTVVNSKHC